MGTQPRVRGPAVLLLVVVGLALAGPVAAAPTSPQPAVDDSRLARQPASEPPVTLAVGLATNGSARWNVSARFRIDTANESAAFQRLAAEFEAGEAAPGFAVETFRALAAEASERTGREMHIRRVVREATVRWPGANGTTAAGTSGTADGTVRRVGVLSLRFTWTNFSRQTGDQIVVGDAFGAWDISASQRLVIYPPPGYGLQSAQPGTDGVRNGGPVWNGPEQFEPGNPAVTYKAGIAPATTSTTAVTTGPTAQPPFGGFLWPAAGVGLLVLLVGVLLVLHRRGRGPLGEPTAGAGDGGEGSGGAAPEVAETDAGASGPTAAGDAAAEGGETGAESGGEGVEPAGQSPASGVDPQLLSDEERVEWLLEQNDGRMRQADIVTETGWSNAKVSQLLSTMDEEDRVEKLRMGRENLISLPGGDEDERP
ncbi:MAG: helix-turn-helix transcriptional regulator [Halobacteriaceae archaeon]